MTHRTLRTTFWLAVCLASISSLASAESADNADCKFCELPGGEYLNAIYSGNYELQDTIAWDYLMDIRRTNQDDASMGVIMQTFAIQAKQLTVLQEFLGNYMRKYAYHDTSCLDPGAFSFAVTWDQPDTVTTINGWEWARREGLHIRQEFRLNEPFWQACNHLCGDSGVISMVADGLNVSRTRYALMDIYEGLDGLFQNYHCRSPEIKQFETNLLDFYQRENRLSTETRRNTLYDAAMVQDEIPDPRRFEPDDRVFPGMAEREAREAEQARAERARGEAVLSANAGAENVRVTSSGLQYVVISPGSGPNPMRSDSVRLHYRGTTIDGNVFADSHSGAPVTLPLNAVIEGWAEGVTLIRPGGEIKLFIPPDLGYGDQQIPGIEPGSTLIFEVELLGIE